MEHTMVHLAETAAWLFVIMIIFAIIGFIATIRWIINMVTSGERAVESGVQNVENKITHHNP
jgi:NADH:ubiquinone oxidoreductase subunit 2 (subunit N)